MPLVIEEARCQNVPDALRCEWLDTNGTGGYASSTILNCHTRKYHGLLVANLTRPAGRFVLLSKFEDSVAADGREFFLSCHKYPGVFFPRGQHCQSEYRQDLYPEFHYRIGDAHLQKSLMLLPGRAAVLLRYHLARCAGQIRLRLKPLLAFRGFHDLTRENMQLQVRTYTWEIPNGFKITPYPGLPDLFIQTSLAGEFMPAPLWYKNFEYLVEIERGFPAHEDLFHPGVFEIPMSAGSTVYVVAATEVTGEPLAQLWAAEEERRRARNAHDAARAGRLRDFHQRLLAAARDFTIVAPDGRPAVIAGYHWFGDWGRDTLIALPGLTFCAGDPQKGLTLLETFTRYERNGLLPNVFGPNGTDNDYKSVDAALWFFWAVQQLLAYTGDLRTVRERLWPTLKKIVRALMAGTAHDIGMEPNGLLHAGNPRIQLTWMDACVNGTPVTPRHGCAVEINALWYNAVCFTNQLAAEFNELEFRFEALMHKIREAFLATFWIAKDAYLGDVFNDDGLDTAVRPNQIMAVSLPYSPLDTGAAAAVVDRVGRELLTPCGLRTLSPGHPSYLGRYEGDGAARDRAYHQGTVWPWLCGHYGEACLKVAVNQAAARQYITDRILLPLADLEPVYGLGQIPEIFDGDPPHRPNGCIAQAWSVGEMLRLFSLIESTPAHHGRGGDIRAG